MPNGIKVSIVLPTYNQAQYLPKCIQSLLSQTYKNFELIIVNDGSTDQTANMLSTISDPRVSVISQTNQKLPSALNTGFAQAKGEYWTWTSTDNIVAHNWLEEMVCALDAAAPNIGCVLTRFAVIDDHDNIIYINQAQRFDIPTLLLGATGIASFLYRASLAKRIGGYDTSLTYAEDLDFWVRMACATSAIYIPTILYYYRTHTHSMSQDQTKVSDATKRVTEKFLARTKGQFVIDHLFPAIGLSNDPQLERFKSRLRLATLAMDTPKYCPTEAIVHQLLEAMKEHRDEKLIGNIAHLYAKDQQWDKAKLIVENESRIHPSPFLHALLTVVNNQDANQLKHIPFLTMGEAFLATSCQSNRTSFELVRNFASYTHKTAEENPGLFAQILTELLNILGDNQDHPEIWHSLSQFHTEQDKIQLLRMHAYLSALTQIPQEKNVQLYLEILEAMCFAYSNNKESAKNKLQNIIHAHPNNKTAQGALAFISE